MTDSFFIDDGQEREGFIAAVEGWHPALRFRYRPLSPVVRERTLNELGRGDVQLEKAAKVIAAQVTSWDCGADPTKDICLRLHHHLQERLGQIIIAGDVSDADPDADEPPKGDRERQIEESKN